MNPRGHGIPLGLIAVTGLALSLGAFFTVGHWETRSARADIESRFQQGAHDYTAAIHREVDAHLLALRSLAAFYAASEQVTRDEFRRYSEPLLHEITSLQALEWAPRVKRTERLGYEARQPRFADSSAFHITERNADGALVIASTREEYYPIDFVEPLRGNNSAAGFDLASEVTRREALHRARDQGRIAVSAPITLVQEQESPTAPQRAFLSYLPVYTRVSTPVSPPASTGRPAITTGTDRRGHLQGMVLAVSRVGDLVASALAGLTPRGIDLAISDITRPTAPLALYTLRASAPAGHRPASPPADLRSERRFDIGGRQWLITATPATGSFTFPPWRSAWTALGTGLIFTLLVIWYVHTLQRFGGQLQRLNRSHQVLSRCNSSLARALTEQDLLDAYCSTLVNVGGYPFAWIGYAPSDPDDPAYPGVGIRVMARAGAMGTGTPPTTDPCAGDPPRPTACDIAMRTGQPLIVPLILKDLEHPAGFVMWRENALAHGYRTTITLPLQAGQQAFGTLSLFTDRSDRFDRDEVALLTELAADLAFGIETLRSREAQKEEALRLRAEVECEQCRRIAGVLHDGVGQSLQAVNLGVKTLRKLGDSQASLRNELLDTVIIEVGNTIAELREVNQELRPLFTRHTDLPEAIQQQCRNLHQRAPIPIHLTIGEQPCPMSERAQEQCFLVFREALNNALKHSQANRIDVSLETSTASDTLTLRIADDGRGFDLHDDSLHPTGHGLSMMTERAADVGGHTRIDSAPGAGTRVTITVPLNRP